MVQKPSFHGTLFKNKYQSSYLIKRSLLHYFKCLSIHILPVLSVSINCPNSPEILGRSKECWSHHDGSGHEGPLTDAQCRHQAVHHCGDEDDERDTIANQSEYHATKADFPAIKMTY